MKDSDPEPTATFRMSRYLEQGILRSLGHFFASC
jgi:hypothetical protein